MQKRYFYSLDGIRGIAALLVVLRHTSWFFGPIHFSQSYLAVDIFFVLSGVVIANAYEQRLLSTLSFGNFLWLRLARLYPLYICATVFAVLAVFLGIIPMDLKHFGALALMAIFMMPKFIGETPELYPFDGPAWSLFFEWIANICYAKFCRVLNPRLLMLVMAVSVVGLVVCCLGYAGGYALDIGWTVKTMPSGFFRVGYSFFAGVLLYRLFLSQSFNKLTTFAERHSNSLLVAILALVAMLLTFEPRHTVLYSLMCVVLVFPLVIFTAMWVQPQGFLKEACKFMGTVSYAVYVLHEPLGRFVEGLMKRLFHVSINNYTPISGVVFLAALIALCWWLDAVYDLPVREFLLRKKTQPIQVNITSVLPAIQTARKQELL